MHNFTFKTEQKQNPQCSFEPTADTADKDKLFVAR